MPSIQAPKTEKIYLPSYKELPEDEQGYVVIRNRILLGDLGNISKASTDLEYTIAILASIITEWNFTDQKTGEELEVTEETIDWLSLEDKLYLSQAVVDKLDLSEVSAVGDTQKKTTSIDISQPSITEENPTPPIQSQAI